MQSDDAVIALRLTAHCELSPRVVEFWRKDTFSKGPHGHSDDCTHANVVTLHSSARATATVSFVWQLRICEALERDINSVSSCHRGLAATLFSSSGE